MDKTYILACLLAFGNENQSYSFHLFFKQWNVLVLGGPLRAARGPVVLEFVAPFPKCFAVKGRVWPLTHQIFLTAASLAVAPGCSLSASGAASAESQEIS